jgi:DNA processing protein
MSAGCNFLIKSYKASMIESGADLLLAMQWDLGTSKKPARQTQLALNLTANEQKVYNILNGQESVEIDRLATETGISPGVLAAVLLEMEMNNVVVSLPGKRFKLV